MKKIMEEITSDIEPDKRIIKEKEVVSGGKVTSWIAVILLALVGYFEATGKLGEHEADLAEDILKSEVVNEKLEEIETQGLNYHNTMTYTDPSEPQK